MFKKDQVTDVIANADEMHGHIEDAWEKLQKSLDYMALFATASPDEPVAKSYDTKSFGVLSLLAVVDEFTSNTVMPITQNIFPFQFPLLSSYNSPCIQNDYIPSWPFYWPCPLT